MKKTLYSFFIAGVILTSCTQRSFEGEELKVEPEDEELIIDPVESMPKFPGGEDSLKAYLTKNNQWSRGN